MSEVVQIKPLGTGAPIWADDGCAYPYLYKLPMSDGRVVTYKRVDDYSHPEVGQCIDLIRKMRANIYGGCKHWKHAKPEEEDKE